MSGALIGQLVGRRFGSYLGQQLALGACREDREDDLSRRVFTPRVSSSQLPAAVDLRPWMTRVENQGSLGSCAANALVGGLEYLVRRETGRPTDLSRLFVYFNQRLWDDCVRDDLGASIGDGVRVLSRIGAPTEGTWPYHRDLFAVQPPGAVFREAGAIKIADWWSVPVDADAFRGCLAAGFPISFGTRVTESFVATSRSGECGMPQGADDAKHGRHALLACGYDDRRRVFVVRNSWGEDWGDRGYVYMPYAYVLDRRMTRGCWALRLTRREAFEAARFDGSQMPKAPPGGGSKSGMIGGVASAGAQVAVGAFTGSGLLAGLAGGLISGLTPGVSKALQGRDRGAFVGQDRGDEILRALQGEDPPVHDRLPWDDGYDEEAAVPQVGEASRGRSVRASGGPGLQEDSRQTTPRAAPAPLPPAPSPPPEKVPPPPPAHGAAPAPGPAPVTAPLERWDLVEALPDAIAHLWREAGAMGSPLGSPVARPATMSEGAHRGSVVRFANGAICSWRNAPPIVLLFSEPCVTRWVELGAGRSIVGWPVGPVQQAPAHLGAGTLLACTRGTIARHPDRAAQPIHGALFSHWRSLGGLASGLGYPLSPPLLPEDPREPQELRFEHGVIRWTAERGAWRA